MMIGVDYHPSFQQIAFLMEESGEYNERRLNHSDGRPRILSRSAAARSPRASGDGGTGYLAGLSDCWQSCFRVWIGDPAEIKTKRVKKQKTDRQDAQLLLKLMMEDRFPRSGYRVRKKCDLRQLLCTASLVQMRTRIMNQLQALAMNEAALEIKVVERKGRAELEKLALAPWPVGATRLLNCWNG